MARKDKIEWHIIEGGTEDMEEDEEGEEGHVVGGIDHISQIESGEECKFRMRE